MLNTGRRADEKRLVGYSTHRFGTAVRLASESSVVDERESEEDVENSDEEQETLDSLSPSEKRMTPSCLGTVDTEDCKSSLGIKLEES